MSTATYQRSQRRRPARPPSRRPPAPERRHRPRKGRQGDLGQARHLSQCPERLGLQRDGGPGQLGGLQIIEHNVYFAIWTVLLFVKLFALCDAAVRPNAIYVAPDKQTKLLWMAMLGVTLLLHVFDNRTALRPR